MSNRDALTAAEQQYQSLLPHQDLAEQIMLALAAARLKAAANYAKVVGEHSDPNDMIAAWLDRELAGAEAYLTAIELHREQMEKRP
jgi:hypothetical protein